MPGTIALHASPKPIQLALPLDFPLLDRPTRASASAPRAQPLSSTNHRVTLNGIALDYFLVRSSRRSIGFMVDDQGLQIRAPKWAALADIENAIFEKQRWILTKLHDARQRSARRLQAPMQWRDGATLPFLGSDITLRIGTQQATAVFFTNSSRELLICLPADAHEQQLKDCVHAWLQQQAKCIFAERLAIYAKKLNVQFESFSLSSATTRWGSCTTAGKIRLNWRLIHFPQALIDYVIAHELSHLREMNHSAKFWSTVQSVFPEFKAARTALRHQAIGALHLS